MALTEQEIQARAAALDNREAELDNREETLVKREAELEVEDKPAPVGNPYENMSTVKDLAKHRAKIAAEHADKIEGKKKGAK